MLMLPLTWWHHQMETFSLLLAICAGNSPVTGEFPAQRPMTWSHDVFFDLHLNKQLSKQSWGCWFEMPSHPLWRNCDEGWDMMFLLWVLNRVYNFPSLMLCWTQSYSSGLSHDDIVAWFHITGPLWGESTSQRWIHSKRMIQSFDDFFVVSLKKLLLRKQWFQMSWALQWRHNEHDGASNHQPHDCLLNFLFRHRSRKTSKLCATGLCEGNSPLTGEFPTQRASDVFIQAQIKENIKALGHWPLWGNSPLTSEFPAQRASNVENVSTVLDCHEPLLLLLRKTRQLTGLVTMDILSVCDSIRTSHSGFFIRNFIQWKLSSIFL